MKDLTPRPSALMAGILLRFQILAELFQVPLDGGVTLNIHTAPCDDDIQPRAVRLLLADFATSEPRLGEFGVESVS